MAPLRVGPYTLLSVLGEGALGRMFLGRTDKGARVAVRVFRPELAAVPAFRTILREEIAVARLVRGPRVAAVLNADTEGDVAWLATEYIPAPSLRDAIEQRGPLSVDGVRLVGMGLAEALQAVHDAGTAHRDLTPGNVLLLPEGPCVTDYGVARAATAVPDIGSGGLVGTPGYLAPEHVATGRAEPASDVFALGSVLLYAATWQDPFGGGDPAAVAHRVLHEEPDLRAVAPSIAPVIAACLHRDPAERPDPRQVRDALAGAGAALVLPTPTRRITEPARAEPVRPVPAVAAAVPTGPPAAPVPARPRSRLHRVASLAAASVVLLATLAVAAGDTTSGERSSGAGRAAGSTIVLRR